MGFLVLGLVLFLGVHSLRIFADDWRAAQRAKMGEGPWNGVYSLVSIAGFALIVWGYGETRMAPVNLWFPPVWTRHLAALLTVPAIVLLVATYVPGNQLKAKVKHPMILAVKVWAFSHLLSNGRLSDVLLFGGFLVWAIALFRSSRMRDRKNGVVYQGHSVPATAITVVVGLGLWALFTFFLHARWIGVAPLG